MNKTKNLFLFLLFLILLSSTFLTSFSEAKQNNVLKVEIKDTIDHNTVEIIKESIKIAEQSQAEAIILILDTPGGGWSETKEIAGLINKSSVPVIGFVYPQGAAAWSAGTFILMSTHIAVMASHTAIGSCQPVRIGASGTQPIEDSKTINALTQWIVNQAEMHNRNKTIARRFITENLNLNATLAKKNQVIEYIANDVDSLLKQVDGVNVSTDKGTKTLDTSNVEIKKYEPSITLLILDVLSNPIITSILFLLGVYALIFGISAPGLGAEVFGGIAILLALIGTGFSLPALSIIFIIIGVILLLVEVFVIPGFGVAGIGGIISLAIGSIFLVPSYSTTKWMIEMSWIDDLIIIMLVATALIAAFFLFVIYKVIMVHTKKKTLGVFKGETAKTVDKMSPGETGYVLFKGEYWKAKTDENLDKNQKVVITDKENSTLIVKSKDKNS
ncbi:MAG: nodulation protein NfeD [Candidatus Thermoplasmatota archaeon]